MRAQDNLNIRILRMFKDTSLLIAANIELYLKQTAGPQPEITYLGQCASSED